MTKSCKIATKTLMLMVSAVGAMGMSATAQAYMFDDVTATRPYYQSSPSSSHGWRDRIGGKQFEVFGVDVARSSTSVVLSLFTNYELSKVTSYETRVADFAIDFDDDTDGYDHAIVLFDHGTGARMDPDQGPLNLGVGLYENVSWHTSQDIFGDSGSPYYTYGGRMRDCLDGLNGSPVGCGSPSTAERINTLIYDGDLVDGLTPLVTMTNLHPGEPLSSSTPKYRIDVTFNGSTAANMFNDGWEFAWGNATCGNDTIHGYVAAVPEPGSLTLLGAGLAILGVTRRRRRKAR